MNLIRHNHFADPLTRFLRLRVCWCRSTILMKANDAQRSSKLAVICTGTHITATLWAPLHSRTACCSKCHGGREPLVVTSPSPTRQKWLWYESATWHNHFYEWATDLLTYWQCCKDVVLSVNRPHQSGCDMMTDTFHRRFDRLGPGNHWPTNTTSPLKVRIMMFRNEVMLIKAGCDSYVMTYDKPTLMPKPHLILPKLEIPIIALEIYTVNL